MLDKIKRIEDLTKEKLRLLSHLRMWENVKLQGIDTDSVLSFGFDPALVPAEELAKLRKNPDFNKNNPYGWQTREENGKLVLTPNIYNFVRMKNGDKVPLQKAIEKP